MADVLRDQLRGELIRVRNQAGLSGRALAARLEPRRTQGTVWRIEDGSTVPSLPLVRSWLAACGVDRATAVRVERLAEAIHGTVHGWSELLGEHGHDQNRVADQEQAATLVRTAQPSIVPGLLQTPEYARAVFGMGRTTDVEAAVARRVERQRILQEPGRRFMFVIAEQALRRPLAPGPIVLAQQDRVWSLARLEAVSVGVVPASAPVLWLNNFVLTTEADGIVTASSELGHGEWEDNATGPVAAYERLWERLSAVAVWGDDAADLIRDRA